MSAPHVQQVPTRGRSKTGRPRAYRGSRSVCGLNPDTEEVEESEEAEEVTVGEQDSSKMLRGSLVARIEWLTILPRRSSSKKPRTSRLLFGFFGPFGFFEQSWIIRGSGA
jgi:hypothetical protein